MKIEKPFSVRTIPTPQTLELLESVTLGSKGARYRHLDTRERIKQLYKPVFLNLERNNRTLANITFCRREIGWYMRYFAFQTAFQTTTKNTTNTKEGILKKQLNSFFDDLLNGQHNNTTNLLYAYIDPKNRRSLLMSHNFGFTTRAKIATQTYSRVRPKEQKQVRKITKEQLQEVYVIVEKCYGNNQLYFTEHTFNDQPFYGYYDLNGNLLAFVKVHKAKWSIERLPGKRGNILTSIIPFIPRLRNIIKPKRHIFSAIEAVWVSDSCNPSQVIDDLFEGVLFEEQTNSIIWWVDVKSEIYKTLSESVNWGLMHKLNGVSMVDLVIREQKNNGSLNNEPFYTTAFDFI